MSARMGALRSVVGIGVVLGAGAIAGCGTGRVVIVGPRSGSTVAIGARVDVDVAAYRIEELVCHEVRVDDALVLQEGCGETAAGEGSDSTPAETETATTGRLAFVLDGALFAEGDHDLRVVLADAAGHAFGDQVRVTAPAAEASDDTDTTASPEGSDDTDSPAASP